MVGQHDRSRENSLLRSSRSPKFNNDPTSKRKSDSSIDDASVELVAALSIPELLAGSRIHPNLSSPMSSYAQTDRGPSRRSLGKSRSSYGSPRTSESSSVGNSLLSSRRSSLDESFGSSPTSSGLNSPYPSRGLGSMQIPSHLKRSSVPLRRSLPSNALSQSSPNLHKLDGKNNKGLSSSLDLPPLSPPHNISGKLGRGSMEIDDDLTKATANFFGSRGSSRSQSQSNSASVSRRGSSSFYTEIGSTISYNTRRWGGSTKQSNLNVQNDEYMNVSTESDYEKKDDDNDHGNNAFGADKDANREPPPSRCGPIENQGDLFESFTPDRSPDRDDQGQVYELDVLTLPSLPSLQSAAQGRRMSGIKSPPSRSSSNNRAQQKSKKILQIYSGAMTSPTRHAGSLPGSKRGSLVNLRGSKRNSLKGRKMLSKKRSSTGMQSFF